MNTVKSSYDNARTITQIHPDQYIIEGDSKYGRFGFEIDPSILTYADFEGGPFLLIGNNFLGKGNIISIESIDSGKEGNLMVKVTLNGSNDKAT